jgi:hypothetical protein
MISEGIDAEVNAWQIESLAGPEFAPDHYFADDFVFTDGRYFKLNKTVIKEEGIIRVNHLRKAAEVH